MLAIQQVLLQDAAAAIGLLDMALEAEGGSVLPPGCAVPTAFDDDPDAAFAAGEDKLVAAVRCEGMPTGGLLTWDLDGF